MFVLNESTNLNLFVIDTNAIFSQDIDHCKKKLQSMTLKRHALEHKEHRHT